MSRKVVKRVTLLVLILTSYLALLLYNSSSTCTTVGTFSLTLCAVRANRSSIGRTGGNIFNGAETNIKYLGHYTLNGAAVLEERIEPMYLHCTDSLCSEYLSSSERESFNDCKNGSEMVNVQEASCHFMNGTGRRPVALASFPGSGNTWVRGLLEKATGICTGAAYCDGSLKRSFPGEGVRGGSVSVVKTHNGGGGGKVKKFGFAIFIIRDPRDATISNWNRRKGRKNALEKHIGSVGTERFYDNKDWDEFLLENQRLDGMLRWQTMAVTWCEYAKTNPLLVVHYDDLKADTVGEVQKMVKFLGMPSRHWDLEERLKGDYTTFKRTKDQDFEHFTPDQKKLLNQLVTETKRKMVEKGLQDIFQLERYMA